MTKETLERLQRYAKAANAELEIHDNLTEDRRSSLWYGGDIATVRYTSGPNKGLAMRLDAIGDVYATLYGKDEELVAEVRDKNNAGGFSKEFGAFLESDKDIRNAEDEERLFVDNNNWYEISFIDRGGNWHDLEWVCESDDWEDAIRDTIDGIEEAKAYTDCENIAVSNLLDNVSFDVNANWQIYGCNTGETWTCGGKLLCSGDKSHALPDELRDKAIRYITVSEGKLIIEVEE